MAGFLTCVAGLPAPTEIPVIESYSYGTFYDTASSPPDFRPFDCSYSGQNTVPSIFFYGQHLDPLVGGVRLTVVGIGDIDYVLAAEPSKFGEGQISDSFFLLADPGLAGHVVTAAQLLSLAATPIGDPIAFDLGVAYNTAVAAGIDSGDADQLIIDWDICHEQPARMVVTRCSPSGSMNYYDPAGPQAGLNPVGATFPQWDTSAIIIDHPAFIGVGPIDQISVTTLAGGQAFKLFGHPIPSV